MRVGQLCGNLSGGLKGIVGILVTVLTLGALLIGAYDALATDAEVKALVEQASTETQVDLARTIDGLLKSVEALESRVINGDTVIQLELVLMDLERLEFQYDLTPVAERGPIGESIRARETQYRMLMDKLIGPAQKRE